MKCYLWNGVSFTVEMHNIRLNLKLNCFVQFSTIESAYILLDPFASLTYICTMCILHDDWIFPLAASNRFVVRLKYTAYVLICKCQQSRLSHCKLCIRIALFLSFSWFESTELNKKKYPTNLHICKYCIKYSIPTIPMKFNYFYNDKQHSIFWLFYMKLWIFALHWL